MFCPLLLFDKIRGYTSVIKFYIDLSAELWNVISNCISNRMPTQIKMLNMVIPFLMHFNQFCLQLEQCKRHNAARHPTKSNEINDFNIFPSVYRPKTKLAVLSNKKTMYNIALLLEWIILATIYFHTILLCNRKADTFYQY